MREQIIKVVAIVLLITIGLFVMYNLYKDFYKLRNSGGTIFEGATSGPDPLEWETNKYKSVTLHDVDDYDIEVRIPAGQTLYATRQGNWGLQEELYDEGVTTGVFMDGKSGDGYIFKGKKGTVRKPQVKVKYQLDTGPYTILYEFRKHDRRGKDNKKVEEYDVNIKVNDRVIPGSPFKNVGVSSGKLKHLGTVDKKMNKVVDDLKNGQPANGEGRRETVVKFIPKTMVIKGNKSVTADVSEKIKEKFTTLKEMFKFKEGYIGQNNNARYLDIKKALENTDMPMSDSKFEWYFNNGSKSPLDPVWDPQNDNWFLKIHGLPNNQLRKDLFRVDEGEQRTKMLEDKGITINDEFTKKKTIIDKINTGYKAEKHFITLFKEGSDHENPHRLVGSHSAFFARNKERKLESEKSKFDIWGKIILLGKSTDFLNYMSNINEDLKKYNTNAGAIEKNRNSPTEYIDVSPLYLDLKPTLKELSNGTYYIYYRMSDINNKKVNEPDLYGRTNYKFNDSFLLFKFHWDGKDSTKPFGERIRIYDIYNGAANRLYEKRDFKMEDPRPGKHGEILNTKEWIVNLNGLECPNDKPILTKDRVVFGYDTTTTKPKCHAVYKGDWISKDENYAGNLCYLEPDTKVGSGSNKQLISSGDFCPSLKNAIEQSVSNTANNAVGQSVSGGSIRGGQNEPQTVTSVVTASDTGTTTQETINTEDNVGLPDLSDVTAEQLNNENETPQNNATMLAQTGSVNPTMNRAIYDASGNLIFENTAAGAGMGLGLGAGLGFGIGMSVASCKGSNLMGGSLTGVSNSITESSNGLTRDGTDGSQFTDITNLADNGKFDVFNYGKVDGRDSKDNRLGGSESAYTDRYKPEDSAKSKIKFFDSVWRI